MPDQLRLELPLLLPEVEDMADACVDRLVANIGAREGVQSAHVVAPAGDMPAQLCVHFDPVLLSLARIRDIAQSIGVEITGQYGHLRWDVDGLSNQRRARTVAERLMNLPGVIEADASASGILRIDFDRQLVDESTIERLLRGMGVRRREDQGALSLPVQKALSNDHAGHAHGPAQERNGEDRHDHEEGGHEHAHGGVFGANTELYFALICGALLAIGYLIEKTIAVSDWVPFGFYVVAYFFGGFFTLREAIDSLRGGKFEIDTLMLVAAAGAAALGAWAEGALLLFLFSIGHALEHYAMGRAKRAIEALAELAPQTALVRRDCVTKEIPVEELAVGDTVVVKPNERMPADGFVVIGTSSVNQAPVTGESMPVDKGPVDNQAAATAQPDKVAAAHRIFAGTINGSGAIEVRVTRLSNDTTLAKVVQMVGEAKAQKSPTTPSAVLSGIARAARGGVLVKGGGPLENLGTLRAIAFDKTGTLTEGRPQITDVLPAGGASESELLRIAVAVEALSDHPLAAAVASGGRERLGGTTVPVATGLRSITGRGVQAVVEGQTVHIGSPKLFGEAAGEPLPAALREAVERLETAGRTTMVVRMGERYLGAIGLMDTPRAAATATLARLRQIGITRMIMISGDNQRVADAIAKQVGLDEAWGDLMPENKVDAVKKLKAEAKVAMVGDGVNDAPAMANATVGIAMGAAGSDVALETADVALMADDLSHLPFAVGLSRQTSRIIRQNLYLSLGVVAILLPATIFGLGIGPAVLAHEGSTLVVVFNALRLLAFKDRSDTLVSSKF